MPRMARSVSQPGLNHGRAADVLYARNVRGHATLPSGARSGTLILMPRKARSVLGGEIYHVMNCGNCGRKIFRKPEDYLAFMRIMEEGRQRAGMRILSYCLMPDHWHMVLWPARADDLADFVGWVSNKHVRHWREQRRRVGEGHLYQGRFKSFPAQAGKELYNLLRYVEGNARRARLVESATAWPYGSRFGGTHPRENRVTLAAWPIPRPRNWAAKLDEPLAAADLKRLRLHAQRSRPYGDPAWMADAVRRMGLEWTVRDRGRPRKNPESKPRGTE